MKAIGLLHLPYLGIIKVSGSEAASFLNSQLSSNILQMNGNEAKLAAYCSPQGRVLASFIVLKMAEDEFLLICSSSLLEATLKRLTMFVMRAKVQLEDVSKELQSYGLVDSRCSREDPTSWTYRKEGENIHIEIPCVANMQREIIITKDPDTLPIKPALPINTWIWLHVRSGITMVSEKIKDQFVPQMLNYESINAIDFEKGCYPGQEVISRSQFRGTLKRRSYLLHAQQEMQVGNEVFTVPKKGDDEAPRSLGSIILAAANPDGGWDAMAVLRTDAEQSKLTLTPEEPSSELNAVSILPLPYLLRDDF